MDVQVLKSQLQAAILGLEYLLETGEKEEAKYQQFFEANPIIFVILGYVCSIPFTKQSGRSLPRDESTGLKPEPDFLVQRQDKLWEIFEIKTPATKGLIISTNEYRERFTAEILSYISQTITYEKYFTRNPANRNKVKEAFQIDIQEDLDIKLVVGLSESIDRAKVHQKCREFHHKIDIITFDEVLACLDQEYTRNFGGFENLPGFSFHAVVRFRGHSTSGPKYFLDIGSEPTKDRISFFLTERSDVSFLLRDTDGRPYDLAINRDHSETINNWIYLVCEFGCSADRFIMTASINGRETDLRQKDHPLRFRLSLLNMVLGTDISRTHFGCFDLAEKLVYDRTLTFRERLKSLSYIATKYENLEKVVKYLSFDGSKFMRRDAVGNFIQPDVRFRPIYRNEIQRYPGAS